MLTVCRDHEKKGMIAESPLKALAIPGRRSSGAVSPATAGPKHPTRHIHRSLKCTHTHTTDPSEFIKYSVQAGAPILAQTYSTQSAANGRPARRPVGQTSRRPPRQLLRELLPDHRRRRHPGRLHHLRQNRPEPRPAVPRLRFLDRRDPVSARDLLATVRARSGVHVLLRERVEPVAPAGRRCFWDRERDGEEEGVVVCDGGVCAFVRAGGCGVRDVGVGGGGVCGTGWVGGRCVYGSFCVDGVWLHRMAESAGVAAVAGGLRTRGARRV